MGLGIEIGDWDLDWEFGLGIWDFGLRLGIGIGIKDVDRNWRLGWGIGIWVGDWY